MVTLFFYFFSLFIFKVLDLYQPPMSIFNQELYLSTLM